MAFTKIVGAGIHTLSNIHSHNVNSSGIITATKFVGPFDGTTGDFSGNVTVDGNLTVNGDTTTLNTTLREVELLRVDATSSTAAGIITQRGTGNILEFFDTSTNVGALTDEGNLGLGVNLTSPNVKLHVKSTATSGGNIAYFDDSGSGTTGRLMILTTGGTASGDGVKFQTVNRRYTYFGNAINHLTIDNTNARVGIGTDSPDGKLDVRGTIFVNGDGTGGRIFASGGNLSLTDGNGRQTLRIDDPGSGNTHTHAFDSSGNLGVGLDSPTAKLHVNGTQNGLQARFGGTGTGLGIICGQKTNNNALVTFEAQDATHGTITFKTAGGERLRITADDRIGINSTSPREKLDIAAGRIILDQSYQLTWANSTTNRARIYGDSGSNFIVETGSGNSEKFRVRSDGRVGIGTHTPQSLLHVHGTGGNGSGLLIRNAHDVVRQYFNDNNNNTEFLITYDGTGGAELTLHADGNLGLNQSNGDDVMIGTSTPVGESRLTITKNHVGLGTAIALHNANGSGTGSKIISTKSLVLSADYDNDHGVNNSFLAFETDGTEKVRITNAGRVLIGHDTHQNDFHGPQATTNRNPYFQLHGENASNAAAALISWKNSAGAYYAPTLYLAHSGSDTKGTNGILPTNGEFGSIVFSGDDGTDFVKGAMIKARLDGTPGNDSMPGRLEFHTTPDGAQVPEERMRISKSGSVGIGTANPDDILHAYHATDNFIARFESGDAGGGIVLKDPTHSTTLITNDGDFTINVDNGSDLSSGETVRFEISGSEKLRIDSDGKVGIGTNNAGEKLDVDGAIRLRAGGNWTTYAARLMAVLDATHTLRLEAYHNSNTPFEVIGTHADSGGSDPRIAIGSGGQPVVIGHTAPYHNYGATGTFTQFAVVTNTGSAGFHETAHFAGGNDSNNTGATLRIGHHGNDRGLYIKAGRQSGDRAVSYLGLRNSANVDINMLTLWDDGGFQKVGIASDSPTDRFDVRIRDNSNDEYQMVTRYRSGSHASGWTASGLGLTGNAKNSSGNKHSVFINFSARHPDLNGNHGTSAYLVMSTPDAPSTYGTGQFDFYCRNGAAYSFKNDPQVASSYQMDSLFRIKSNGHVSVRSGSLTVSAELNMHTSSEVANDKFFDIGFSAANKYFRMRRTAGNDTGHSTFLTVNQSDEISGDFVDTSDGKLKKNIAAISDGAIEDIKKLRPVTFDWIADSKNNNVSGFIAQEIKEVLPNLVSGTEYDPTLNDPEKGTKGGIKSEGYSINSIGVTAHLTKALQEAIAKIEVLEAKVAALESS